MSYFSRAGDYVYSTITSCGQSIAGCFDALNRTLECCDASDPNSFQFNDGLRLIAAGLQYTGMNVLLASSNIIRSINISGTAFLSIHMFAPKKINDESCGAPKGHGVNSLNIVILTTAITLHYVGKEIAIVIGEHYHDKQVNKRVDYQLENLRRSLLNISFTLFLTQHKPEQVKTAARIIAGILSTKGFVNIILAHLAQHDKQAESKTYEQQVKDYCETLPKVIQKIGKAWDIIFSGIDKGSSLVAGIVAPFNVYYEGTHVTKPLTQNLIDGISFAAGSIAGGVSKSLEIQGSKTFETVMHSVDMLSDNIFMTSNFYMNMQICANPSILEISGFGQYKDSIYGVNSMLIAMSLVDTTLRVKYPHLIKRIEYYDYNEYSDAFKNMLVFTANVTGMTYSWEAAKSEWKRPLTTNQQELHEQLIRETSFEQEQT